MHSNALLDEHLSHVCLVALLDHTRSPLQLQKAYGHTAECLSVSLEVPSITEFGI